MGKAVLLSIKPKWVEKIASGEKTVEVRKTRPKLKTPFKCYIYQTGKNLLKAVYGSDFNKSGFVIGEFICFRIYEINNEGSRFMIGGDQRLTNSVANRSFLDFDDLKQYAGSKKTLYGLDIEDLEIYDEPKELSEFGLKRPPQSWQYVEELELW